MSKVRRTQSRYRVTDCISQVPLRIQKLQNHERRYGRSIIGCKEESSKVHRLHQDATSCKTSAQATGDRLLFMLIEDDDMRNLLSPGVHLNPSLVMNVKENHRNTLGTFGSTNFSINTASWCICARECMCESFQMSQIVELTPEVVRTVLSHTRRIL